MAKITLDDIGNIFTAATPINQNNAKIEVAFENTLSRDGTSPNAMNSNLDMNNHRVYNLPAPLSPSDAVRLQDIDDIKTGLEELDEAVAAAAESAAQAGEHADDAAESAAEAEFWAGANAPPFVSLNRYGSIGDNVYDNKPAFDAAMAVSNRIYLPEGTYYTTNQFSDLADNFFWGPGKIRTSGGDWAPGNFVKWSTTPTPGPTENLPGYWQGDLSMVTPEYWIMDANVRRSLTSDYFEPTVTPHWQWADISGGHSGTSCRLTGGVTTGTTTIPVTGTSDLQVGDTIAFLHPNGTIIETKVIQSLTDFTITFATGILGNHPTGLQLSVAARTNHSIHHAEFVAKGGGDSYISHVRLYPAYQRKTGQDHFFFTQTVGIDGGDATAGANGVYMQSREMNFLDAGFDVAVISEIRSFNRTNDAGALGVLWNGRLDKSEGTKYCESNHVVIGKWKRGLDYGMADFGTEQAAIGLGNEHRIYWGMGQVPDVGGFTLWSQIIGTCYIRGVGGATPEWSVNLNGVPELQVKQDGVYANIGFRATAGLSVPTAGIIYLGGWGSNTHITFNGTHVYLVTNGVAKQLD